MIHHPVFPSFFTKDLKIESNRIVTTDSLVIEDYGSIARVEVVLVS